MRQKYRRDLEGLRTLEPQLLARLLGGEILPDRPYASVRWVLYRRPFRPLEMYWLFADDPEEGPDLRVLFARRSLAVPTEDAYVFAWDYLALLARYGRGTWPLLATAPGKEWLVLEDFAPPSATPLQEVALRPRRELLKLLAGEVVATALARMEVGRFEAVAGGWRVTWPVLGDLALRLTRTGPETEVAFDSFGARKYPPEFLMSFAWLYTNALIRECRAVDPRLPRLSRYL